MTLAQNWAIAAERLQSTSQSALQWTNTSLQQARDSAEAIPYRLQLFQTFLLIAVVWYGWSIARLRVFGPPVPFFGTKHSFENRLVANYRFFKDSASIINIGYNKFKGKAFFFARNDADIIVLPPKFVEEVRVLPHDVANPTSAHSHNLLGRHTNMDIILTSNLHFRMIQNKLTPALSSLAEPIEDELNYALAKDFPDCKDQWVTIEPYHLILRLVSRISARVFVGLPICRDERWLEISTQFTENIFVSVCLMRLFPTWMHAPLKYLLPSIWRGSHYIRQSKKLLVPEIKRRAELWKEEASQPADSAELGKGNLLAWMMECAEGFERNPDHLAHLEIVISLASIHTSQMNAVHVLYDLAAHPEMFEELRAEIREVARGGWDKSSYTKLRKLDSFMKESQRFNPPSLLSYHRIMTRSHTLSDGTHLPAGAHIAMAVNAIQNDSDILPDPDTFDGLRYYKLRQREGEAHKHQFVTTEPTMLNFGHGRSACPGRFFASLEIKSILVKLIMNYDFKLPPGQGRPANLTAHEFIFPNPEGKLLVKARDVQEAVF